MKITMLPLNPQASELDLHHAKEACGLPLFWAVNWPEIDTLEQHLACCYGFPMLEMSGGSVATDGTYSYPEDSDLEPLAKVEFEEVTFYQYNYGIVAIVTGESTFITRMD